MTVNLDGLGIAVHNFTLSVNDTSGNTAFDTVFVTVMIDDVVPVIVFEPDDVYYSQGETNILRNWTVTDDFMANYSITIGDDEVVFADWESETIEFDFAGLAVSTYNVTLTVTDLGGNSVSSTVTVVVTQAPIITYITAIAIGSIVLIAFIVFIWYVRYR